MADWSDYYSGQRVDSLARCVALRHHDARVVGSVPELGSFNTVTRVVPGYTSESNIYRRQIRTSKIDSRTVRNND